MELSFFIATNLIYQKPYRGHQLQHRLLQGLP